MNSYENLLQITPIKPCPYLELLTNWKAQSPPCPDGFTWPSFLAFHTDKGHYDGVSRLPSTEPQPFQYSDWDIPITHDVD